MNTFNNIKSAEQFEAFSADYEEMQKLLASAEFNAPTGEPTEADWAEFVQWTQDADAKLAM